MHVIDRKGKRVAFDMERIDRAVESAFLDVRKSKAPSDFTRAVHGYFETCPDDMIFSIESIQDIVETLLMTHGHIDVARSYIAYRKDHANLRFIKERADYIEKYTRSSENAATSSETDANANVKVKNVANLNGEVYKTTNRLVQRYNMQKMLKQLFPDLEHQYAIDLENHVFYTHDESSFPMPVNYCQAVSSYPFMLEGSSSMDGLSAGAPRNLSSYAGQFTNLVFLLSAQCKGAVAYGEFFNVFDYYCVKEFGPDYMEHTNEFVHIGPELRKLFNESGRWCPDLASLAECDFGDDRLNGLRDRLVDSSVRGATLAELEQWYQDYRRDLYAGLKLDDGTRTIGSMIHQTFQQIIYGINQPAGNRSFQSPFTNISYYDRHFWNALFEDFRYPDGTLPSWERISFLQKNFMKWLNKERERTLLTFPVETMALLHDGRECLDKEYEDFQAEMYAEGHSFFTYLSDNPGALASCCRLRNEIQENVFSFTNGLTGVQTGSANVMTINFNRLIQDWARERGYSREYLREHFASLRDDFVRYMSEGVLERIYCYQTAYKTLLFEVEKAGLLTASNAGYISMSKLYSTIGLNGVNEAAEFAGIRCSYNGDYRDFIRAITIEINRQNKLHGKKGFLFNTEFVPAESLGSKNYNWDKEDGYWVPEDRVLYNSYFYLADDPNTSVLDKFRLHGKEFTEFLDGGVGLHCNLDEHLSKEQYRYLNRFAIQNGTTYYTFNVINSECTNERCHHIVKKPLEKCPKCGAPMRGWTRVIGYMVPIEKMDTHRQELAKKLHYSKPAEIPV